MICLPYELQYILPNFKKDFLDSLRRADAIYDLQQRNAQTGIKPTWIDCLGYYSECEYIYRVDQIVSRLRWFDLTKENWTIAFKVSFETFFNSIPTDDNGLKTRWKNYFRETCDSFGIASLKFIPMKAPSKIHLEFNQSDYRVAIPSLGVLIDAINQIVSILDKKLILRNQNYVIRDLILLFKKFYAYFEGWRNQAITYEKYYELRKEKYPKEIQQLEVIVPSQ